MGEEWYGGGVGSDNQGESEDYVVTTSATTQPLFAVTTPQDGLWAARVIQVLAESFAKLGFLEVQNTIARTGPAALAFVLEGAGVDEREARFGCLTAALACPPERGGMVVKPSDPMPTARRYFARIAPEAFARDSVGLSGKG